MARQPDHRVGGRPGRRPAAGSRPWDSYYAVRLAWKDPAATIFRGVNLAVVATELRRIESPQFLDIRRAYQRTTLLCGGLPYHRRMGDRKLDTLLVVHGETARSFRLGVGLDVPQPLAAALGFLSPPLVLASQPRPPITSGWLFHLDCRNVLATHWEPLVDVSAGSTDLVAAGQTPLPVKQACRLPGETGPGRFPRAVAGA